MARKVAFLNQKGGVGKTTATINVGASLARRGKKVLLVDTDPQSDLTGSLGLGDDVEPSIHDVYAGKCDPVDAIVPVNMMEVLPANITLAGMETSLMSEMNRERFLRSRLKGLDDHYDYILLDCPPSLGLLTINSLVYAEEVIIPLQTQYLAMKGFTTLVDTIKKIIDMEINPDLRIGGVIKMMVESNRNLDRDVIEAFQDTYGNDILFDTDIRKNAQLAEAPSFGQDIFTYRPTSRGAEDFSMLTNEILKRHEKVFKEVA